MDFTQLFLLAIIQGAAELLPVSSSAHVIVTEKLLGLDPSSPEMVFLLVMLHTGTMFSVLISYGPRWKKLSSDFWTHLARATVWTLGLGFALKMILEKLFLQAGIESLFKDLRLISVSLFFAGIWILFSSRFKAQAKPLTSEVATQIGIMQAFCLPFRGFSRSGATISMGLVNGLSKTAAEEFSFALGVILTPPVLALSIYKLLKMNPDHSLLALVAPGAVAMVLSGISGFFALKLLSKVLEKGKWNYFGIYCLCFSMVVYRLHQAGF